MTAISPFAETECRRPDLSAYSAYKNHGCRCERCRAAKAASERRRTERRALGADAPPRVSGSLMSTPGGWKDPRLTDPEFRTRVLEDEWARRICEDGENWWASDRPGAFQRELAKRKPPPDTRNHGRHSYLSRDTFGFGWGS